VKQPGGGSLGPSITKGKQKQRKQTEWPESTSPPAASVARQCPQWPWLHCGGDGGDNANRTEVSEWPRVPHSNQVPFICPLLSLAQVFCCDLQRREEWQASLGKVTLSVGSHTTVLTFHDEDNSAVRGSDLNRCDLPVTLTQSRASISVQQEEIYSVQSTPTHLPGTGGYAATLWPPGLLHVALPVRAMSTTSHCPPGLTVSPMSDSPLSLPLGFTDRWASGSGLGPHGQGLMEAGLHMPIWGQ
jgi:hypothetical protein